ncbi:MAG: hypothetical protein EZS26_001518 [Candidatus Ordinivivax streblomastigis]|uniref:Uncharacterized protein n=1 Tax=Candidatus Ordinivivax streblomastigis TaxID=2540710 RepID=A0A5M8P1T7_9BACT|nr:MAG: hypothetical protein EZS26_001518 [Candidatus Ordinivivax streblomastigis]
MNTGKKIIILFGFLLIYFVGNAQNGLNLDSIFENYGKQKGSVLVDLRKDVLENHTKIVHYKSLIMNLDDDLFEILQEQLYATSSTGGYGCETQCINGKCTHFYHQSIGSGVYEYYLLSKKSKKMTLIYVKGKIAPGNALKEELNKLKDLFINVNNNEIKL